MLIPFLVLLQAALAGPAVRTDSEGLMGSGNTIEFTILDVNERCAAVRHVYTINDDEERPEDCNYPGLGDHRRRRLSEVVRREPQSRSAPSQAG